jgi:glycosyltransferase involved in cell wall biosynthesis
MGLHWLPPAKESLDIGRRLELISGHIMSSEPTSYASNFRMKRPVRQPVTVPVVDEKLKLTHYGMQLRNLSGVARMLQWHHDRDVDYGIDSEVVPFFQRKSKSDRIIPARMSLRNSIVTARRRFRKVATRRPVSLAVYHDLWGIKFMADMDEAGRRIGVIHSDFPDLEAAFGEVKGLLDGVLCISQPLLEKAERIWPELKGGRMQLLPYPVELPKGFERPPRKTGKPFTFGYCGRIQLEKKRVDRIPEVLDRLAAEGQTFRMELLGDGYDAPELQRQLSIKHEASFHGQKKGEEFWRILAGWDAILFPGDAGGMPLSLLDAIAVGVIPVYPNLKDGGEAYVRRLDDRLLYPEGDMAAAAAQLVRVRNMGGQELVRLRKNCKEISAPHIGSNYFKVFSDFSKRINSMERISQAEFGRKPRNLVDWCPLGVMNKLRPLAVWKTRLG